MDVMSNFIVNKLVNFNGLVIILKETLTLLSLHPSSYLRAPTWFKYSSM